MIEILGILLGISNTAFFFSLNSIEKLNGMCEVTKKGIIQEYDNRLKELARTCQSPDIEENQLNNTLLGFRKISFSGNKDNLIIDMYLTFSGKFAGIGIFSLVLAILSIIAGWTISYWFPDKNTISVFKAIFIIVIPFIFLINQLFLIRKTINIKNHLKSLSINYETRNY